MPTSADTRLLEAIDLYTGVTGRVDDARAHDLLLAAAEDRDDALSQMWMARVLSRGRMGFERDEPRAREIADLFIASVRALAARGDIEAIFLMGTAYDEGLGVEVDYPEAVRWYRLAGEREHVLGMHNLGNVYRDGRGVEVDHVAAAQWWLRAARVGDAITQLRLGEAYEAGRGAAQNLDEAISWYETTAAEALNRLRG